PPPSTLFPYTTLFRSRFNRRKLRGGDVARRIGQRSLRSRGRGREQMSPIVGRCAGNNSVVVLGKTLRFHQRLPSTIGTGTEVRPDRKSTRLNSSHDQI